MFFSSIDDDFKKNDNIDSMALYNLLQEIPNNKVIIDCRDSETYSKGHVRCSINLCPPPSISVSEYNTFNIENYIKEHNEASFWNSAYNKILVYSDKPLSLDNIGTNNNDNDNEDQQQQQQEQQQEKTWEQCLLNHFMVNKKKTNVIIAVSDTYQQFENGYPFMCVRSKVAHEMYPSEIIKSFLYLGGETATVLNKLKTLKITHVVNMASEIKDSYSHIFKYYRADLDDRVSSNIDEHFQPIIEFIEDAKRSNGRVLVHCAVGVSRSASVVIAYLMKTMETPYLDTFKFVRSKRCIINPNPGFVRRLKAFDLELLNDRKKQQQLIDKKKTI